MTMFSGGHRPTKTFILNDNDGTDKLLIKNARGFTVAEINSKGDIKRRGVSVKY